MIGSLVVVYPTQHQGGSLVLRHGNEEWTFDSGKALANLQQPSVAYIAFFSDVEHEVAPVQKGYRVTLTYNLYLKDTTAAISRPLSGQVLDERASAIKTALSSLLHDASFYPQGGFLGFGLFHEYPVRTQSVSALSPAYLKGRDAILYAACEDLGLPVRTTFFYEHHNNVVLCDDLNLEQIGNCLLNIEDGRITRYRSSDGLVLYRYDENHYYVEEGCDGYPLMMWVTKPTDLNNVEKIFIAYGNEVYLEHCYGRGCLVVEIGEPGKR